MRPEPAGLPSDEIAQQLLDIGDLERSTWSLGCTLRPVEGRDRNKILEAAWDSYPWLDDLDGLDADADTQLSSAQRPPRPYPMPGRVTKPW